MKSTRTMLSSLLALAAIAVGIGVGAVGNANAQSAGAINAITPMTRDLGTLKTITAGGAGTYTSADQTGFNVSRVICNFYTSTSVGSPTVVLSIQNKDYATGAYYDLISSATIQTATTQPVAVSAGGGVATTSNVGAGVPIARYWRAKAVVGGSTSVTGTIGCSVQ